MLRKRAEHQTPSCPFQTALLLLLALTSPHAARAASLPQADTQTGGARESPRDSSAGDETTREEGANGNAPNVTYIEAVMGGVSLSERVLSRCFNQNGTLSFVAQDTVVSVARIHVRKKGSGAKDRASTSDTKLTDKTHMESTDPEHASKQQSQTDTPEEVAVSSALSETSNGGAGAGGISTFPATETQTASSNIPDTNVDGQADSGNDSKSSKNWYSVTVGSSCTLVLTVPDLMFAKVEFLGTAHSFCAGSGDLLEAEVRDDVARYCDDAVYYVNAGEDGKLSLLLGVTDSQEQEGWLDVRATGSVKVSLQSPYVGTLHSAPTGPHHSPPATHWAMLKTPPRHKLMLSLRQRTRGFTHPVQCRGAFSLPFVIYYGNVSSHAQNTSNKDVPSVFADGNWTHSDTNVSSYSENTTSDTLRKLDFCGSDVVFPVIINADFVLFRLDTIGEKFGVHTVSRAVQLVFSLHQETEVPTQSADGKWDCSVPGWSKLLRHFPCDLEAQCRKGEDESHCFYSSKRCGHGLISVGGSCYFTVNPLTDVNWLKANEACAARDGYLVSLNSPAEVDDVRALLLLRPWMTLTFVGLQAASVNLPSMYRHSWIWTDGTVANYINLAPETDMTCGALRHGGSGTGSPSERDDYSVTTVHCTTPHRGQVLCEVDSADRSDWPVSFSQVPSLPSVSRLDWRRSQGSLVKRLVDCPAGHLTHSFLACDVSSACFAEDHATCRAPMTPLPPMYDCACADERIPYSLVCDHRKDCQDNSDEEFCVFPPCKGVDWFRCNSHQQCVPRDSLCDGQRQCRDGSDEGTQCETPLLPPHHTPHPPLYLSMDRGGVLVVDANASRQLANGSLACPQTHFTCSSSSRDCLPVFLRCNQVQDCPRGEDEVGCRGEHVCPGFFRCRDSNVCIHPDHLCDGLSQCPQQEDETFCSVGCPPGCTCYGLALKCAVTFEVWMYPGVRYLDGDGSGLSLWNLTLSWYLVHVSLARGELRDVFPANLPNLRTLDLSDNLLKVIPVGTFSRMENLRVLSLAGNPLALPHRVDPVPPEHLRSLRVLDLSRVRVRELYDDTLTSLGGVHLEVLNLSESGVDRVTRAFNQLTKLRVLDLRGCPLSRFPPSTVFKNMYKLTTVFADNYKLCCRGVVPFGFDTSGCAAPDNQLSSCDSLLKSNYYRLFVYLFAALALLGNVLCMGYRTCVNRRDSTQTASVFVSNLSVANFMMGLYLVMIAAADWSYKGSYVWGDVDWRKGSACQIAGFLFVLSNEVSVFFICLMTADRYLVLRNPQGACTFQKWSAHAASLFVWLAGFVLASVPLYPSLSHWEFYSQTALCVPLPVSQRDYPGHAYSFFLFNVVKLLVFVYVGVAQGMIYALIKSTRHAIIADKSKKSMDIIVARRLVAIAMTDFLSWFPIGLLGMLNATGTSVTGEIQVILALFILPLNSALNPFLYTISMERDLKRTRVREKIREDVLSQARHARLQANENRAVTFATRV